MIKTLLLYILSDICLNRLFSSVYGVLSQTNSGLTKGQFRFMRIKNFMSLDRSIGMIDAHLDISGEIISLGDWVIIKDAKIRKTILFDTIENCEIWVYGKPVYTSSCRLAVRREYMNDRYHVPISCIVAFEK